MYPFRRQYPTKVLRALLLLTLGATFSVAQRNGAIVPVTLSNTLAANDDGSTEAAVPLNIGGASGINFFGQTFTDVYVNNNGNLTFGDYFGEFTPNGLATGVGLPIIAPFFADVDTRGQGSGLVQYGNAVVGGRNAFVANYVRVGYYGSHTDKLNSFQVVLLDRSDTGAGNFDIELNYDQIQWETGDASGGNGGLGGTSAVAGYSNGVEGGGNVYFQLPGSLVNGALLDGGSYALASHSIGSTVPGRYIFEVRNGVVMHPPTGSPVMISGSTDFGTIPLGGSISATVNAAGGTPPYSFSASGSLPTGLAFNGATLTGTPTYAGRYQIGVQVTDAQNTSAAASISFSVFGLTTTALPNAVTSSYYLVSLAADGGTLPYTFTATGLPPGFGLSSSGVLSGTPLATGSYTVPVKVTDGNGVVASASLNLTVTLPPPIAIPTTTLPSGTLGVHYSQALNGTGGAPPLTWNFASGTLPPGLAINSSGVVSGTPTATGTFQFNARATDVTGGSATGSFTLVIAPMPLTITTAPTLSSGVISVDYPTQQLTASGGVGPYSYAVTSGTLPAGLTLSIDGSISGTPTTAGTFAFAVTATDSTGVKGTAHLQINIRPFGPDLFLSAGSLTFSMAAGASVAPPSQNVQVQSTVVGTIIPYAVATTPDATWLSVTPASGSTPGAFSVALTSQAFKLGASGAPYQANVIVTCKAPAPCAGNSQTVAISLTVNAAPPQLSVNESLVAFTASPSASPTSQTLELQNTGGGSVGISSIHAGAPWLNVSGVPGSIPAGQTVPVALSVDPTGLTPGYYRTTVTVVSSTGTTITPVTFFIAANPSIALQPVGAQFQISAGGVPGNAGNSFLVSVSTPTAVSWTASVLPGADWLRVNTPSGTSTSAQPGTVSFSIDSGIAASLAPRAYYGRIRVASTGTVNSPLDFEVVLNVAPAGSPLKPAPSPAGLLFLSSGATPAPPQTVQLFSNAAGPIAYQSSVTTADGQSWLSVSPSTGAATPGGAQSQVSVNPAGLAAGVYYGGVNYAFGTAGVRTVNVTLVVEQTAGGSAAPGKFTSNAAGGSCTPTAMAPSHMGLVNNFSAPASWPTPLALQIVNDCGAPIPNAQVVATFSNGDAPLALSVANPSTGLYSGTWTPRHSASQVTITARASAAGFPAVSALLSGSVTPNNAPVLTPNSTLHVFDPQVGSGLGPGTIVQMYGSYLAAQTTVAPSIPLATSLGGTSVIIGGIEAPLYFVSAGQINAQVPFELKAGQQYQVIVNANGALTTPDTIQLTPVSPGIAALPSGTVIAQHGADGSLVTESSPAKPGEYLVMYLAGLGSTDNPVTTGDASPSNPLARPVDVPTLTLGGQPVNIAFAGLTPGLVGLYQANFQVPANAPDGDLTLVLSQDGLPGNSTILPVHK